MNKNKLALIASLILGITIGYAIGRSHSDRVSFTESKEFHGRRYEWTVDRFVDGDSFYARLKAFDGFDVFNVNIVYQVRIVGIDTPEEGKCGYDDANSKFEDLVGGSSFYLLSGGTKKSSDQYGRLLRYVQLDEIDVGLKLINEGLAVAAYDSFDLKANVGPHARESEYRSADKASKNICP